MVWQGDQETRIDRFDGRALLDFLPEATLHPLQAKALEKEDFSQKLQFERYFDLIEAQRLEQTATDRLLMVDEEWNLLSQKNEFNSFLQAKKNKNKDKGQLDISITTENDSQKRLNQLLARIYEIRGKERKQLKLLGKSLGVSNYFKNLKKLRRERDDKLSDLSYKFAQASCFYKK
jgi:arginine/serine-rich splicing factor 16